MTSIAQNNTPILNGGLPEQQDIFNEEQKEGAM